MVMSFALETKSIVSSIVYSLATDISYSYNNLQTNVWFVADCSYGHVKILQRILINCAW